MLNKPRYQSAAAQRQYDIPGASLRGPYKRWIPQMDSRLSESETDGPKSSSLRPRGHHGSSSHAPATETSYATTSTSNPRNPNGSSSQHHAPAPPQPYRSERTPYGYSSESTVHAPVPSKSSSSGFNLFKPHTREPRGTPGSASRREEPPRPMAAPAASSSRHQAAQPMPIPQAQHSRDVPVSVPGAVFGSFSTQTSTDPSPRSSTDSGPRSGHASAPAAENSEARRHGHAIWNPYVDAKLYGDSSSSRKPEVVSVSSRREDKRVKDKEDMVARVTEALGGGSTGKAKVVESALLHGHVQAVRGDDASSTRRTTSSMGTRVVEGQSRTQPPQAPPTLRRHKTTPQATPLNSSTHLPDTKNSRPSTTSSRINPEVQSRVQSPPEPPPSKPATSTPKLPSSSTSTSKLPHSRTTSSPWPFNQALPTEQATTKPQPSQSHSTGGWRSFSRFHSSTHAKPPDVRSPPRDTPSHQTSAPDPGRGSQIALAPPPPSKSLPRSTASHTPSSRSVPPAPAPAPAPVPPILHHTRSRLDGNPSYATTPMEQSQQRWSPNTQVSGRSAASSTVTPQPSSSSQAPEAPTSEPPGNVSIAAVASEAATATGHAERYLINDDRLAAPAGAQSQAASGRSGTHQPVGIPQSSWPISSKYRETTDTAPAVPDPAPAARYPANPTQPVATSNSGPPPRSAPVASSTQQSQNMSQPLWLLTSKHAETTSTPPVFGSTTGRYATNTSQTAMSPPAGTWTSTGNFSLPNDDALDLPRGFATSVAAQVPQSGARSNPPTPPEQDAARKSLTNGLTSHTERHIPGAWTSKYLNANLSITELENVSTPKPSPKATISDGTTTASKYTPASGSATDQTSKALRYQPTNPVAAPTTSAPGAWTTSSRYATNTSGSIFDASPNLNKSPTNNTRETSATMRQATLGTNPAPGAWTIKTTPNNVTSTSSGSTPKQTPPRHPSPPASLLKPPPPSGTGTGSSTPSSAQVSDVISHLSPVTSHSISTRVPISGHPSTPAPVRPALRPTPPPLSISSTSPDTDSLLTPSSLNSPRSTIILPQSQPVATITASAAPLPDKDKNQRKGGFFGFLRPKPPLYEVWTPPIHNLKEKERKHEESAKGFTSQPPKPKSSAPVPTPRPKSPKIFSPLKLFSRRHRTISTASLDVLDGTAANTVMNSPASSMRADAPPSPPLRDAILATQEWRNKEATELVVSGRKRRPRPGVTFDCPEDIAPVDIIPSRLRVARMLSEDDDDY